MSKPKYYSKYRPYLFYAEIVERAVLSNPADVGLHLISPHDSDDEEYIPGTSTSEAGTLSRCSSRASLKPEDETSSGGHSFDGDSMNHLTAPSTSFRLNITAPVDEEEPTPGQPRRRSPSPPSTEEPSLHETPTQPTTPGPDLKEEIEPIVVPPEVLGSAYALDGVNLADGSLMDTSEDPSATISSGNFSPPRPAYIRPSMSSPEHDKRKTKRQKTVPPPSPNEDGLSFVASTPVAPKKPSATRGGKRGGAPTPATRQNPPRIIPKSQPTASSSSAVFETPTDDMDPTGIVKE